MTDSILTREISLACAPAHAFAVFVDRIDLWWPRGHRKSKDGRLRFDAGPRGRIVEVAADGSEWTMAAVRAFEPPALLRLDWFPGSPQAPTSVAISFEPRGDGTLVTIIHDAATPPARELWPQRVALFERGWDTVLPALRDHVAQGGPIG